jgi:hypothetical protein
MHAGHGRQPLLLVCTLIDIVLGGDAYGYNPQTLDA